MTYDTAVPTNLKNKQQWFAGIITQPMDEDSRIHPFAPSGNTIQGEAAQHIAPSPTLEPWQRIQIYNQQYWWRLIKILQNIYPMVVRLFGYEDFNKSIAVPYLVKYASIHWSIDHIGDRLPRWIEEEYHEEDKALVYDAICVDHSIDRTFTYSGHRPIGLTELPCEESLAKLLDRQIYLQPWVTLFELKYDLFRFRDKLLEEEVEHWLENDFPALPQEREFYHYAVYRDADLNVSWNQLSDAEYYVLSCFEGGNTIENACEWLEKQDHRLSDQAAAHIHFWFQEWTLRNWLTLKPR